MRRAPHFSGHFYGDFRVYGLIALSVHVNGKRCISHGGKVFCLLFCKIKDTFLHRVSTDCRLNAYLAAVNMLVRLELPSVNLIR
jgi:hypothetical protein